MRMMVLIRDLLARGVMLLVVMVVVVAAAAEVVGTGRRPSRRAKTGSCNSVTARRGS